MKKVILTGAAMMAFAAASFAQNTVTLNQVGNNQTGNASQSGNLLKSTIQQTSTSTITNVGNYAATTQESAGYGSTNNEATVNQLGTKSGFANIQQQGSQQKATINQQNNTGGNGTKSVAANGPAPAENANNVPNTAGITAVTGNGGNYANAFQRGNNETVTINQNDNSTGNYADTRQDSFSGPNTATVNQNGGSLGGSSKNSSTVNQFGDRNTLSISQSNSSDNNKANVRQGYSTAVGGPSSFDATATVEQNGGSAGSSSTNEATITQVKSFNNATIQQNDDSKNNMATVSQSGNTGSTANVSQSLRSSGNKATVDQSAGGGHLATVNQNGNSAGFRSENNMATVTQTGTGNQATVNQLGVDTNGGGDGIAISNKATVTQSGTNDVASILQSDASYRNEATIKQYGSSTAADKATIEQITNTFDSKASINQAGTAAANTALISQREIYNFGATGLAGNSTATIDQNTSASGGGNLSEIYQGRSLASEGNAAISALGNSYNLKATSSQQGSDNVSRLYQVGHDMDASLTQTGDKNVIQGTSMATFSNYATQLGDNNKLTVTQTSAVGASVGNTASVYQNGSGNTAMITQSTVMP